MIDIDVAFSILLNEHTFYIAVPCRDSYFCYSVTRRVAIAGRFTLLAFFCRLVFILKLIVSLGWKIIFQYNYNILLINKTFFYL